MIKLRLEQLTEGADTIVQGAVTRLESAWNAQHTAIYTDVTMLVEEVIKGAPSSEVTFRVAGGIVGDIGMATSDDPVFHIGEQTIVFLNTKGDRAAVVGLHQGKYGIRRGEVMREEKPMSTTAFIEAIRKTEQRAPAW